MKKIIIALLSVFLMQNITFAKEILQFDFPNEGWHQVVSPDGDLRKKAFVPYNQSTESYTEMLTFNKRILKNKGITPIVILQKQLGKDRLNYKDIEPNYIVSDFDNAMVTWCSKMNNMCVIQRAFQGNEGIIIVTYTNKMPHYSQNMFGQWSNILSHVKLYNPITDTDKTKIEL
jgi:hypothetical protein